MTHYGLARLRELDQTASPAPWSSQRGFISTGQASLDITNDKQGFPLMRLWADMTKGDREVNPQDDFTLIIETRNALPALLAEIDRLTDENTQLLDTAAEAWDEGYQDKETEAPEEMIERGLRKRAQNPYRENKGTRQ